MFDDCRVTSDIPVELFYLSRPWRPYVRTVFMKIFLDDVVEPAKWHNWQDPDNEETALYAEYRNEEPGTDRTSASSRHTS